jgi:hypothetical protein
MMNDLHRLSRIAVAALLSGAAGVAVAQQTVPSLDVKTGLWEVTFTSSIDLGGTLPVDTSKMPPAQKAQIEQTMKAMSKPRTDVQKKCMTKEEMAKTFLEQGDDTCTDKVTSNTATLFDMTRTCAGDRPSTTQVHLEASTPEKVNGNANVATALAGGQQKMAVALSAKWLAAECGSVK